MVCKILPGLPRILRDRQLQGLEAVVLLLVAQLLQEAHAQVLAIELAVMVEKMHLEQRQRHRVDRWPPADARHAAAEAVDFDHEDARDRWRAAQHEAGGRKT